MASTSKFVKVVDLKVTGQSNLEQLIKSTSSFSARMLETQTVLSQNEERLKQLNKDYKEAKISTAQFEQEQRRLNEQIALQTQSFEDLLTQTNSYNESLNTLNSTTQNIKVGDIFRDVSTAATASLTSIRSTQNAFSQLTGGIIEDSGALRDVNESLTTVMKARELVEGLLTAKQQINIVLTKARTVGDNAFAKTQNVLSNILKKRTKEEQSAGAAIQTSGQATNAAGDAAKNAATGFNIGSKALNVFKISLASVGIGIILIALTELSNLILENTKFIGEITSQINALGAGIKTFFIGAGDAQEAYRKELEKGRASVANELRKNNNEVINALEELQDALLDGDDANLAQRRAIQLERLQRDADYYKEALKAQGKFTEDEIAIITNENNLTAAEYKKSLEQLEQKFQGEKQIRDKDLELVNNYSKAYAALLKEQNVNIATTAEENLRIARSEVALIEARTTLNKTAGAKLLKEEASYRLKLAEIQKRATAGEFLNEQEKNNTILAAEIAFQSAKAKIREDELQNRLAVSKKLRDIEAQDTKDFAKIRENLEKDLNDEIETLNSKRRLGDIVAEEEYTAVRVKFTKLRAKVDREEFNERIENAKQIIDFEIRAEERRIILSNKEFERRKKLNILSINEIKQQEQNELNSIENIRKQKLKAVDEEAKALENIKDTLSADEYNRRFNDITQKRTEIENEAIDASTAANEKYYDTLLEAERRRTALFTQETNNRLQVSEREFKQQEANNTIIENQQKRRLQNTASLFTIFNSQQKLQENINEQVELEIKKLNTKIQAQKAINLAKIQELSANKEITAEIQAQIDSLTEVNKNLDLELSLGTEKARQDGRDAAEDIRAEMFDKLSQAIEDPLKAGFASAFSAIPGLTAEAGAAFGQAFSDIATQGFDLFEQNFKLRLDKLIADTDIITKQREDLDKTIEQSKNEIAQLENQLSLSSDNFDQASLSKQDQINNETALLKQQEAQQRELAKREEENLQKIEKLKKEQAKRDKVRAVANIVQQTGLAILSALAQVPKVDFGIAAGVIAAGYSALGAAQIAAVLSQQEAKEGGLISTQGNLIKYNNGGIIGGPSHAFGGVRINGTNIEAEGGEAIISKKTVQKYPETISKLLEDGKIKSKYDIQPQNIGKSDSNETKQIMKLVAELANRPNFVQVTDIISGIDNYSKSEVKRGLFK